MKERSKVIIAIIAVLLIIAIVIGATYAYWTWQTASNQQTNVSFTLPSADNDPNLYANLTGSGTTSVTSLVPATCTNSKYAIQRKVEIKYLNKYEQTYTVTAALKVTAFSFLNASYKPSTNDLKYLKWAVTTTANNCGSPVASGTFEGLTMPASGTAVNTGLPLTLGNISFDAPKMASEDTKTYYLYIWLDSSYQHQNTGSTNSDPMEGLTFTTKWTGTIDMKAS